MIKLYLIKTQIIQLNNCFTTLISLLKNLFEAISMQKIKRIFIYIVDI